MKAGKTLFNPPRALLILFLIVSTLGTMLLKLPQATTTSVTWLDSWFTAISAITVTGLVVVDTGSTYTMFGEIVILFLIQVGGLGIMSFAIIIFILIGKKIGVSERLLISQSLNQKGLGGVIKLVRNLFIFSLLIEVIGAVILSVRWMPVYGVGNGIYAAIFHSISAYNNAGFSIWADSLSAYVSDPIVNIVITLLFILGGIGFTVLIDLKEKKHFRHLSLHTKLMVVGTVVINLIAFFIILTLEWNNPATLGPLNGVGKGWGAFFQAVSPRTAGFNSIDIGSMEEASLFFTMCLMFIGAGSASTGGGIKLTTFMAMLLSVNTFLKGKNEITVFHKTLAFTVVIKALAITVISTGVVFLGVFILELTQESSFMVNLYEVVSAFGTVGLSMGLTTHLNGIGKVTLIIIMMVGKLGPLTLAFIFASKRTPKIRYPSEEVLTG
ncbi:TrkH family potassium uptake protein [Guptibacillus hwajinpoensis]|uniref:Trk system potassium uptake protein TrkH n=1 Tax=Guptibacillus hwajinpoensis TaxID=208199 RepID=A0ABU0K7J7_9BACL|nr:TrkH family potassium uptake protein [Alkalihalobacillus hemicentroti]MDQ0484269.1 trk system potassium uptake protein TrkH [Alkalihalobacillus hemicentroti]